MCENCEDEVWKKERYRSGFKMLQESALGSSVHGSHEVVDELLAVAVLAALYEVQSLLVQAAGGGIQLERPQEVGALCEGWAHIEDLVDQILNADDIVLAQLLQSKKRQQDNVPVFKYAKKKKEEQNSCASKCL